MPADRAMSRNLKNSGKGSNSRIQVGGQSLPHNTQHSTSEPPKQRKKRNQIADQVPQPQQPRQSVFERLGTKNSGTAPIPRSAKAKKETKEHPSGNELRKTRRFSESRQAERELSDGELTQDNEKIKDRQTIEVRSKADGSYNKGSSEYKTNDNTKSGNHVESPKDTVTVASKESKIPPATRTKNINKGQNDEVQETSRELHSAQNNEVVKETNEPVFQTNSTNDKVTSENLLLSSDANSVDAALTTARGPGFEDMAAAHTAETYEESEDAAKEDVVSIQADDDFILPSDYEDYPEYKENFSSHNNVQLPIDQGFKSSHEVRSDRNRDKDPSRTKENDISKDLLSEVRNRQVPDGGRTPERDRNLERPIRDASVIQSHKDDRRRGVHDRDPRERLREERYNRIATSEKDHRDHRPHDFDRDRRERERQERYNQSIMEDKVHSDVPRRPERDRTTFEHERARSSHGSHTPTADTSSNGTVRGEVSRSSSVSDKEKIGARRSRSLERSKKDDQQKDRERDKPSDLQRDREYDTRNLPDISRDREQASHQRDDLSRTRESTKNRELRPHEEVLKDRETAPIRDRLDLAKIHERDPTSIRKVDEKEAAFRRIDDRTLSTNRRPDDLRPASSVSERNIREHSLRDREKDSHYQRETSERLRVDSLRRDDRQSSARPKESLNDPAYQDIRERDRDSRQKGVQPNISPSELDRVEKKKREELEQNDRKPYYDRDQRNDSLGLNQRPLDYRTREKDRDVRQQDEFPLKDAIRAGLGREQDRELSNRRDDRDRPLHERTSVLPDLYRPSSDHHVREPDRRPIREFERDYRNRDMRVEIPGVDRYRADYPRDNHQGRERLPDNLSDRHSRDCERRPSWELEREKDYRVPGAFVEKDLADNRRDRERTRENEFESRGNSDEKVESHKQSYLQPERRVSRSLEIDQVNRVIKLESVRRVDNERIPLSVNDKHLQEIRVRDEKSTDVQSKEGNQDLVLPKDEDDLPYPWKKCISSKNKVYYYNTETHASYWNYPSEDNGKKQTIDSRQSIEQSEGGKHTDYESSHKDDNGDVDTPRKKLRLTAEHESIDRIIMPDNRKDSNNERSIGPDEQLTLNNTPSSRDLPLRDSESSVRRTRSNTINNITTTPPKMQTSYSEASQSSPTIRSPASMFGDRRYSADYESRRGPYASPQLQSPSSSLRNPFGRIPPSEFYDHNDMFRHDDFGAVRGPGGIMDMRMAGTIGGNISGVMMPQVTSQLPTNNRSGRFIPNHSFGMDQGPMPGVRRMPSVGRGGLPSTHFPPQYRRRSSFEDERIEEEQMNSMIGIETENGPASSHRFNGNLRNPVGIGNKNESDEEAWRTEDEMVDFELADTEPQSLLFRHPVPYNQFSQPLPDNEIIRRQVAPVWNHITSSVAGDELFQQFEHIMNDNSHSRKRKREMRILNSRKEFEQRRVMHGGRRMFRYKHLFATPRQLPKTAYPDYFVYPKLTPEIPDELVQSCIDIYQFHNENTVRSNNGVGINVEDNNTENRLNRGRIEDTSGIEDESAAEVSKTEDGTNK